MPSPAGRPRHLAIDRHLGVIPVEGIRGAVMSSHAVLRSEHHAVEAQPTETRLDPVRGILVSLALGGVAWGLIVMGALALLAWL